MAAAVPRLARVAVNSSDWHYGTGELNTLAANADALSLPPMRFVREDILISTYGAERGYYAARLNDIGSGPDDSWTYLGKDSQAAKQMLRTMVAER